VLGAHGPNKTGKVGMGGYLFTDIVGPTRRIGLSFTYAYHLKITETIKLSLGLSGGLLQFSVDASKLTLHEEYDLVLNNTYQKALVPDFGCGFYLYHEKFYVGLAAPQIYPAKLKFADYISDPRNKLATHFYASAGYRHKIGEDFLLEPCLLMKYVAPVPLKADLGVRVTYKEDPTGQMMPYRLWLASVTEKTSAWDIRTTSQQPISKITAQALMSS
jgi:type IX secretion system PorP/SprF family membrane protein